MCQAMDWVTRKTTTTDNGRLPLLPFFGVVGYTTAARSGREAAKGPDQCIESRRKRDRKWRWQFGSSYWRIRRI